MSPCFLEDLGGDLAMALYLTTAVEPYSGLPAIRISRKWAWSTTKQAGVMSLWPRAHHYDPWNKQVFQNLTHV